MVSPQTMCSSVYHDEFRAGGFGCQAALPEFMLTDSLVCFSEGAYWRTQARGSGDNFCRHSTDRAILGRRLQLWLLQVVVPHGPTHANVAAPEGYTTRERTCVQ